eukprot:4100904-Pleurochrysis_carterae.AAC.1
MHSPDVSRRTGCARSWRVGRRRIAGPCRTSRCASSSAGCSRWIPPRSAYLSLYTCGAQPWRIDSHKHGTTVLSRMKAHMVT